MADKEVNLFIVDLGESMRQRHQGRKKTDLDYCLPIFWDKIGQIIATGRKTALVSVVGLGTDGTDNHLAQATDGEYDHITVELNPQQVLGPQVAQLRRFVEESHSSSADAISGIVVAINIITTFCRHLKYKKRIYLLTNARSPMEGDDDHEIRKQLSKEGIELHVIGIDFDDSDLGFKEEDKDSQKLSNERMLAEVAEHTAGSCVNLESLLSQLGKPSIKAVRPVCLYRGTLTLGYVDKLEHATMSINIQIWPFIMQAKAQTEKTFAARADYSEDGTAQSSITMQDSLSGMGTQDGLSAVKRTRTYQVDDPTAPGGKRDVDKEQLEKGFEYGRTAVHVNEDDMSLVRLETEPGLEIVGFVLREKFERYLEMGKSSFIGAVAGDEKEAMALSSVIHGLVETEQYAVARYVSKAQRPPIMVLLAPYVAEEFEALIEIELPFAEDVRNFKFPPLDKVVTVGGKKLLQHRTLPSDDLMQAMSNYVDSMDLSNFAKDDAGQAIEYGRMQDTFNPFINRINQVVQHRMIYPDDPLPEPYDVLTKYMHPPKQLLEASQSELDTLIHAADVKKVPPRQKGKRRREPEKPLSGLDVDALLSGEKRQRISQDNAIPEFKQVLAQTTNLSAIEDAAKQMGEIVERYYANSPGTLHFGKALECLYVLRQELIELEEPDIFNAFLRQLKSKLLGGKLGGERTEAWYGIRVAKLGLIDNEMSESSSVSPTEAREFYAGRT